MAHSTWRSLVQASIRRTEERRKRKSRKQLQKATMVRQVLLQRPGGNGPFGFSICGPVDMEDESTGIFIASVTPGSVAALSGLVRVGDHVLRVNQHDVRLASMTDAITLLKNTGESVKLALASNTDGFSQYSPEVAHAARRNVKLRRPAGCHDVGITLFGRGQRGDAIYIGVVHSGGLADRNGGVIVGDRLLSLDTHATDSLPLDEVRLRLSWDATGLSWG